MAYYKSAGLLLLIGVIINIIHISSIFDNMLDSTGPITVRLNFNAQDNLFIYKDQDLKTCSLVEYKDENNWKTFKSSSSLINLKIYNNPTMVLTCDNEMITLITFLDQPDLFLTTIWIKENGNRIYSYSFKKWEVIEILLVYYFIISILSYMITEYCINYFYSENNRIFYTNFP